MNPSVILALAALLLAGQAPSIEPPPLPDFVTPVDYVAWYEKQTAVPAGQNALDMYGVFLYAAKDSPDADLAPDPKSPAGEQLRALVSWGRPWRTSKNEALGAWLGQMEPRFYRAFVDGAERPRYAPRPMPALILLADLAPPRLSNARAVGQMMFARAWLIVDNTIHTERFIEAVRTNLALANHLTEGVTLEDHLFAAGHRALVYDQIKHAMRSRLFDVDMMREISAALEQTDAAPVPARYATALYIAEARALQLLQHLCTTHRPDRTSVLEKRIAPGKAEAYFSSRQKGGERPPAGVNALVDAEPAVLAAAVHEYYESLRGLLASPSVPNLRARMKAIDQATFEKHPALSALVTPLNLAVTAMFQTEAKRRMAHLYTRMAIQFKETNEWPSSPLSMDIPNLAAYRIDPFSGEDFRTAPRFTRTALYSVGPDETDDHGDDKKDLVFWVQVLEDSMSAADEDPDPTAPKPEESADEAHTEQQPAPDAPTPTPPPASPAPQPTPTPTESGPRP